MIQDDILGMKINSMVMDESPDVIALGKTVVDGSKYNFHWQDDLPPLTFHDEKRNLWYRVKTNVPVTNREGDFGRELDDKELCYKLPNNAYAVRIAGKGMHVLVPYERAAELGMRTPNDDEFFRVKYDDGSCTTILPNVEVGGASSSDSGAQQRVVEVAEDNEKSIAQICPPPTALPLDAEIRLRREAVSLDHLRNHARKNPF